MSLLQRIINLISPPQHPVFALTERRHYQPHVLRDFDFAVLDRETKLIHFVKGPTLKDAFVASGVAPGNCSHLYPSCEWSIGTERGFLARGYKIKGEEQ